MHRTKTKKKIDTPSLTEIAGKRFTEAKPIKKKKIKSKHKEPSYMKIERQLNYKNRKKSNGTSK